MKLSANRRRVRVILVNCKDSFRYPDFRDSRSGRFRSGYGMYSNRSSIETPICIRFILLFLIFLSTRVERIEGRKCVCTSKACKEAGADTCETKYSCYTELILTGNQEFGENTTTRGCTEGATPLLCETKSWVTRSKSSDNVDRSSAAWIRMPWPRLKCCDSHDYCNADRRVNVSSTWIHDKGSTDPVEPTFDYPGSFNGMSSSRGIMGSIQPDPGPIAGGRESSDQFLQNRVKPLHVAALVLAIAALISVLAACYVITRFLKTNPYTVGSVE
ncbi:PREDICTED: uncharacterized protein LOC108555605 [Eufriesea mexicana]|uniref:uncharacterized protein LOC108555605 n=1 Tax=Eufriesea mexicana TaxID=516756 RepID=UPI00083BA73B|nr:PREDICTED: uncharacterized protein LOC108555605 [Eufriesea mexicana]